MRSETTATKKQQWMRRADGVLHELTGATFEQLRARHATYARIGPVGQPRHKRRWISITTLLANYVLVGGVQEAGSLVAATPDEQTQESERHE